MPNIKQQKKRVRTNEESRERNVSVRSRVKTFVKKAEQELQAGKPGEAVGQAIVELDMAARKCIMHKRTIAQRKSRLQRKANSAAKYRFSFPTVASDPGRVRSETSPRSTSLGDARNRANAGRFAR